VCIRDADTVECPYCKAQVGVPPAYRESFRLAWADGAAVAQANAAWNRYKRLINPVPVWITAPLLAAPVILITGGMITATVVTLARPEMSPLVPGKMIWIWWPSAIALSLVGVIWTFAIKQDSVPDAMAELACVPAGPDGKYPGCRSCGAILDP